MSLNVGLLYFLLIAAPATACGPRTGFTIKNTLPPLPNLQLPQNTFSGIQIRVYWTTGDDDFSLPPPPPQGCILFSDVDDVKFLKTSRIINKPSNTSCSRLRSVSANYRSAFPPYYPRMYCEDFIPTEEQSKNFPDLVIIPGPLYLIQGHKPGVGNQEHSCKVVPKIVQRK